MQFNHDELSSPEWLNDDYFRRILCKLECDSNVRLIGACVLRPGTKAGDHFASVMYRTTLQYYCTANVKKTINLIMKIKPDTDGFKKDLLDGDDFFGKEIRMYTEVLPQMAALMRSIGEEYQYPKLVFASHEPHTIIILEDVSSQGWTMEGLIKSFSELEPTIDAIAKFHAASVVLQEKDPTFASQYQCTIAKILCSMRGMTDGCFRSFISFLSETAELQEFVAPVEHFHAKIDDVLQAAYAPSETFANVLIHGDFHFKNLLHLQSGGKIVDTIFVDYQMCSWCSPVVDLYYLTYMIPEQSVKNAHRDEIIYRYHQKFASLLRRLNYRGCVPTLTELQVELLRKAELELYHYIVFSAFRHTDLSKVDSEAFFLGRTDNPALKMEEFKETMKTELRRFLYHGIIEN